MSKIIKEINDPNKRTIPRSPAFIKMLMSISNPNKVDIVERFSTNRFFLLDSSSFNVSLSQIARQAVIPRRDIINNGSVSIFIPQI